MKAFGQVGGDKGKTDVFGGEGATRPVSCCVWLLENPIRLICIYYLQLHLSLQLPLLYEILQDCLIQVYRENLRGVRWDCQCWMEHSPFRGRSGFLAM